MPTAYAAHEAGSVPAPEGPAFDGMLVLVVDDEERDRYLARQALAHLGCMVEEAGGAEEALLVLASRKPAAIVPTSSLPGLDGMSLLAELRSDPATEAIPVVIRTWTGSAARASGPRPARGARRAQAIGEPVLLPRCARF